MLIYKIKNKSEDDIDSYTMMTENHFTIWRRASAGCEMHWVLTKAAFGICEPFLIHSLFWASMIHTPPVFLLHSNFFHRLPFSSLKHISQGPSPDIFSSSSASNLSGSNGSYYWLYADNSQIYSSGLNLSPERNLNKENLLYT